MANRYGRRQKRAHRQELAGKNAEIALLTAVAELNARRAKELLDQVIDLRGLIAEWDSDIREMLGEYSAFRLEEARMAGDADTKFFKVPIDMPAALSPRAVRLGTEHATLSMVRLKRLSAVAEEDMARLRQVVRLIIERPDGSEELHLAYDVDKKPLMTVGKRDRHPILRAVAQALFESARSNQQRAK